MLKLRKNMVARIMALLTGMVFLNMSFFLTEVRLLGLHISHTKMIENVVKALAGVGFEEEKDSMGESGSSETVHFVDLHMSVHPVASIDCFFVTTNLYGCSHNLAVATAKAEIITPPPKFS